MQRLMATINFTVAVALVLVFAGCSHMMNSNRDPSSPTDRQAADDGYAGEITELDRVIRQDSKSGEAKNAHLKLAQLYSDHNNQSRNYHKALQHLEAYMTLQKSSVNGETLNWMATLKEIDRLSSEIARVQQQLDESNKTNLALKRTNHKLTQEEINLRDKNRKLEESNQKLQQTIEMLKRLDRRLEEKRKNFQ
jgi:chromosome segregation ATPase